MEVQGTDPIPPLKGEICRQYTRCGKASCKCASGHLHGPYYYRIWREGSKVRKVYVRETDLDRVRDACARYRALDQQLRELRIRRTTLTLSLRRTWKHTESLLRSRHH